MDGEYRYTTHNFYYFVKYLKPAKFAHYYSIHLTRFVFLLILLYFLIISSCCYIVSLFLEVLRRHVLYILLGLGSVFLQAGRPIPIRHLKNLQSVIRQFVIVRIIQHRIGRKYHYYAYDLNIGLHL